MHILKSIHVNAFQIFTSGRYSSVQLVSLSLSEDFGGVTIKFA